MSQFDQTLLENLNDKQKEAVLHTGSPLLILAGAGTGKTRVITVKIAWMLDELQIPPSKILAVTFTNKAAKEMQERLSTMSKNGKAVMIRTFHSFCTYLLRNYGSAIGLERSFNIYDDEQSLTLLKSLFPDLQKSDLKKYSHLISRSKDYGLGWDDDLSTMSEDKKFAKIYQAYQNKLDEIGNCDFGDLILKSVKLLSSNLSVLSEVQNRFRAILVDEYQDSNIAQFKLLELLYCSDNYLSVVGDDDQSIYKFRGAEVENILNFSSHFPNTQIIKLEENYRSTTTILDGASSVVANNSGRLGKKLWSSRTGGAPIKLYQLNDQREEANLAVSLIDRDNPQNTAILFRTNAQSRPFEEALGKERIPYRLVGTLRFLEREEIKDIIAYLALFLNPKDEIAFRRIINKPARAIGEATLKQIMAHHDLLQSQGDSDSILYSLTDFYRMHKGKVSKTVEGIKEFLSIYNDFASYMEDSNRARFSHDDINIEEIDNNLDSTASNSIGGFVKFVMDRCGLYNYYKDEDRVNDSTKALNLDEFYTKAKEYEDGTDGLVQLLQDINLDNEIANSKDANEPGVVLITMHNTKGLEFEQVIVTGMEEGLFPSFRSIDEGNVEEERRICYVSMTRAKSNLVLTCCKSRLLYGRTQGFSPSRFLREIPRDLLEIQVASDPCDRLVNRSYGHASNSRPTSRSTYNEDDSTIKGKFKVGDGVYHSDYGEGMITSSYFKGEKECVYVRFATGAEKYFIADYSNLEKVEIG